MALWCRMAEHVVDCPYYRQGYIHEVGAVQQARDRGVRIDRMAGDIRRLLSHQTALHRRQSQLGLPLLP